MNISISYPETKKEDFTYTIHDEEINDPYHWLEDLEDEDVQLWIEKQNELYHEVMEKLNEKSELYEELIELYDTKTMSLPHKFENRYFYNEREGLKNHSITFMTEGSLPGEKKELLNPNNWSEDGSVSRDWMYPSHDGSIIAYGKSKSGSEKSTLYLKNTETGEELDDVIERTRAASVVWLPDNSGFYYTKYPKKGEVPSGDENYYRRLYLHRIGSDSSDDPLIFGEDREKEEWVHGFTSSRKDYLLVISSSDWTKNDLYFKKIEPGGEFNTIAEDKDGTFHADILNGKVYIYTDWRAPRGRILVADLDNLDEENWKEIIPESEGIIQNFKIVGKKLVVRFLEDVHTRIGIYSPEGDHLYDLQFPTMGTAHCSGRWDSTELLCSFQSFFFPPTIYRFNLKNGNREIIFQRETGRDLSDYKLKQIKYKSKDGTEVPMWLMYKGDVDKNGKNPIILTGYGGFNSSMIPSFDIATLPWLDKGGIKAVACMRGGGEYGKKWHKAGMLENKQNVFDDFFAASNWLIENKWTNPDKLAIRGGSNGGLLMGAAFTQHPELYGAVVCAVPLLDMLRYHEYNIARLWIYEYGSAESKEQFEYLKEYSPYHNVDSDRDYPPILFTAGRADSRVHPMHAMKMAALLQDIEDEDTPILLYVEPKAGHGPGKPLKVYIRDKTNQQLFLEWHLGIL